MTEYQLSMIKIGIMESALKIAGAQGCVCKPERIIEIYQMLCKEMLG